MLMRFLRSAAYVLLITLLAVSMTENVRAQSASTSVSNLNYPSRVLLGRGATVTFTVSYTKGYNGDWLGIAIFDNDATDYARGNAVASPTDCDSNAGTEYSNSAICGISTLKDSASIDVTFDLRFDTVKSYSLQAAAVLLDSGINLIDASWSRKNFTISVTDKFAVQVITPISIPLTIDGVPQGLASSYLEMVYPGSHIISVPEMVNVSSGKRLRFDHWSDGSTSSTNTVHVEDDTNYTVSYVTQYKLVLITPRGAATGADWYDEGATAEFSVPSSISMSGILGTLGGKYDFQGWYENKTLVSSSNNGSLKMTGQHSLTASWAPNYATPITILGIVVVTLIGLTFYLVRKKPRPKSFKSSEP